MLQSDAPIRVLLARLARRDGLHGDRPFPLKASVSHFALGGRDVVADLYSVADLAVLVVLARVRWLVKTQRDSTITPRLRRVLRARVVAARLDGALSEDAQNQQEDERSHAKRMVPLLVRQDTSVADQMQDSLVARAVARRSTVR